MSLATIAGQLVSISGPSVKLQVENCLHAFDKKSTCMECIDVCPVGAIEPGRYPQLDADACQGCLACLPACPVGAFSADDAVSDLLECAARLETPVVELICGLHPQPGKGFSENSFGLVVPGCLSGLGVGAGMALASLGFSNILYRCEACSECPWSALFSRIHEQVAALQHLLVVWDKQEVPLVCRSLEKLIERPFWDVKHPPLSRRDLFRLAASQGRVATARTLSGEGGDGERQPGKDRLRMLRAAAVLGELKKNDLRLSDDGGFALLSVSEDCTACGACERVCPAGAISLFIDEGETKSYLLHFPQYCVACGLCEQVCVPGAIKMAGVPSVNSVFGTEKPLLLRESSLKRCERCNSLFAGRENVRLCPSCRFRQENPFGAKMVPH